MLQQPLKFKRRRKCPIPKSTFTTFMDEGVMHYRAGHFRKALYCFDRALELQPGHQSALVARSQCHLKLGDAAAALQDAENSFDKKITFIRGLYQYAESLFSLGQFESALIAYNKGYRIRRDVEGFRIGIQKCQEAIRRAIEDRQATQIEDLDVVLPLIDEMEAFANQKKVHCCIRPDSTDDILKRLLGMGSMKPSKARALWVDREVLGQLQIDKIYLTRFLRRPDIQSDQGGSEALRTSATEALKYLEIREHFWRFQNPMYARKIGLNFNNEMVLRYEREEEARQEASRKIKMDAAEGAVLKNISLIEHALSIGRAKDCQLECERTIRQMKEISTRILPRKPEFMCEVLHYKGLALMMQKIYEGAGSTFQAELDIATENKIVEAKNRALDFLAKAIALKGNFSEAAEVWDHIHQSLKDKIITIQRAYLFHEIGRCYLETNKPDIAKYYGNQGLEEAAKIDDYIWSMKAHIMLAQCEVKMMNLEAAAEHYEKAEDDAVRSANKSMVPLLREAQQCVKVWQEKREHQENEQLIAEGHHSTDDDDNTDSDRKHSLTSGETYQI